MKQTLEGTRGFIKFLHSYDEHVNNPPRNKPELPPPTAGEDYDNARADLANWYRQQGLDPDTHMEIQHTIPLSHYPGGPVGVSGREATPSTPPAPAPTRPAPAPAPPTPPAEGPATGPAEGPAEGNAEGPADGGTTRPAPANTGDDERQAPPVDENDDEGIPEDLKKDPPVLDVNEDTKELTPAEVRNALQQYGAWDRFVMGVKNGNFAIIIAALMAAQFSIGLLGVGGYWGIKLGRKAISWAKFKLLAYDLVRDLAQATNVGRRLVGGPYTRHTVAAGENPTVIARLYNTTPEEIIRMNPGIKPTQMRIGSQVTVPGETPRISTTPVMITADARNIEQLAARYGTTVEKLRELNSTVPEAVWASGEFRHGSRINVPGIHGSTPGVLPSVDTVRHTPPGITPPPIEPAPIRSTPRPDINITSAADAAAIDAEIAAAIEAAKNNEKVLAMRFNNVATLGPRAQDIDLAIVHSRGLLPRSAAEQAALASAERAAIASGRGTLQAIRAELASLSPELSRLTPSAIRNLTDRELAAYSSRLAGPARSVNISDDLIRLSGRSSRALEELVGTLGRLVRIIR